MVAIRFEDRMDDVRRIFLSGRLDTAGSEEIASQLADVAASAKRRVLIDLSNVTFLSSMGIRAIIASAKEQQAKGGRVVLNVGGNDVVSRTLEATGVDELIAVFDDVDDAERALVG
jgi:anti-sigma B factor antagonist